MTFYTYMWLRENGTPYYVGKGHGRRAFENRRRVHPPKERARIVIQCWASEQEAFEMEQYYIRLFGRKDNGTGILHNLTDGGEDPSNPSAETRRRLREARALQAPLSAESRYRQGSGTRGKERAPETVAKCVAVHLGRKRSAVTCRNISKSLLGKKRGPISEEHRAAHARVKRPDVYISNHTRWHVSRHIVSASCSLCQGVE
jgi:hypothetical protein